MKLESCMGLTCELSSFYQAQTLAEVQEVVDQVRTKNLSLRAIGETSNVLLPKYYEHGLIRFTGDQISVDSEDNYTVIFKVQAGYRWADMVEDFAAKGLWGTENLAAIPGLVGTAPVQNIGAYGVELADVLIDCDAVNLLTGESHRFRHSDCRFGYRDSMFKHSPDPWLIYQVRLKLAKQGKPKLSYGGLAKAIAEDASPEEVVAAITQIRASKLPDPWQLPNTGSFFHNPIVSASKHAQLLAEFPGLVAYPLADGQYKLAAGWLIDQAGLKGVVGDGGVCMYEKQALVLTNPQRASRELVLNHARYVQETVLSCYGVRLVIEPSIL